MTYRVTNSMMQSLLLNDMHNNLNKLLQVQQQLSTQRKYNSASENPNAVTKGMSIETMMAEGEQYIKNLQDAVSWLKFTDSALGSMNDIFHRIRELTLQAGDGALVDVDFAAIGAELRQIKLEMMSYANSAIDGAFLFAGLKTGSAPFALGENGDVVYSGNSYEIFWEFARMETGQVSLTGRDVFPLDETTNYLKSIEVPIDFEWEGRGEILEFTVGWRTIKVRIPEKWADEVRDSDASNDYNRYRDSGELEGYSLQEIAGLINNSTEMGDVSKLLKATVVTDNDRGVQYLMIKSNTGEPVSLTSWPETDAVSMAEGIMGAAFGAQTPPREASAGGTLDIRFLDNNVYSIQVEKGDTLLQIAEKLNGLQDGRIWAAVKNDGVNEWIDIVARNPGDKFFMDAAGGAAELFSPGQVTVTSSKSGLSSPHSVSSADEWITGTEFSSVSDGSIILRQGSSVYQVDIATGQGLAAIESAIDAIVDASGNTVFDASVSNGVLSITALDGEKEFTVTATGGLVPLFSAGVFVSSGAAPEDNGLYSLETSPIADNFAVNGEGALSFIYDGKKYWVDISICTDLQSVAGVLETALQALNPTATVEVKPPVAGTTDQWLEIKTDKQIVLSGYGSGATVIGKYSTGSESIKENTDHTHIGFAAFMGMETAMQSREYLVGESLGDTTASGGALDIKIVSGDNRAEIFINDVQDLTLETLAERINGICGDWLEAVVETDAPDGSSPFADPLYNNGANEEAATQRLVLRTKDGAPFAVYDGLGRDSTAAGSYAAALGINTALGVENKNLSAVYPDDGTGAFDENIPALLEVTVGEKVFKVKVCRNNADTGENVAKAIVMQVNEQYGSKLLDYDENVSTTGNPADNVFAVYALTGEPLRVADMGYGDPRYADYTGGIALDLGIAAGVTNTGNLNTTTLSAGTIRISTPGHSIDLPVLATDTPETIAKRLKEYAGSWLDVSYVDRDMGSAATGEVRISIAAKDGSAVSVFDLQGNNAANMGLSTGLVGSAPLASPLAFASGDTLSFTVNGATHTIALYDDLYVDPATGTVGKSVVSSAEELANLINTRFQGQDIHAEVIANGGNKYLALYSPKGYNFSVGGTAAAALGFGTTNNVSPDHGHAGEPFNQVVVARTGDNQKKTDFFGVLDNLIDAVEGEDIDGLSDIMIGKLDNWMSTLLKCRAIAGALTNRYQTTESRYTANNTGYTELHNTTVGVDLAEVYTQFETASSVYQASLAAIARIIQPTLLDFLS